MESNPHSGIVLVGDGIYPYLGPKFRALACCSLIGLLKSLSKNIRAAPAKNPKRILRLVESINQKPRTVTQGNVRLQGFLAIELS